MPFLCDGHGNGDRILVIAGTDAIRSLRAGLPDDCAIEYASAAEWYRTPGQAMAAVDDYLHGLAAPRGRVRVIAEPPWAVLPNADLGEWACFESAFNLAFASDPVQLICPYRITEVGQSVLAELRRTHPELVCADGAVPSADYVQPEAFQPGSEPDLSPSPPWAAAGMVDGGNPDDVARFATRRAFDAGVFGRVARNFGLAAREAAGEFFGAEPVQAELRVWTECRELICELDCPGRTHPRITGYLPPHPRTGDGRGLWLTRQVCRIVRLRSGPHGTLARLHYPIS